MRKIPLTKGRTALVDDKYYGQLMAMGSWCYQSPGYEGTMHYLGLFDSQVDAAIVYNTKALELAGEFASLNEVVP